MAATVGLVSVDRRASSVRETVFFASDHLENERAIHLSHRAAVDLDEHVADCNRISVRRTRRACACAPAPLVSLASSPGFWLDFFFKRFSVQLTTALELAVRESRPRSHGALRTPRRGAPHHV
jgi:hypothetical protein